MTPKQRAAICSASVPDDRPVPLRLDYDAGRGVGASNRQRQEEQADIFSFRPWQMGQAGFQP